MRVIASFHLIIGCGCREILQSEATGMCAYRPASCRHPSRRTQRSQASGLLVGVSKHFNRDAHPEITYLL